MVQVIKNEQKILPTEKKTLARCRSIDFLLALLMLGFDFLDLLGGMRQGILRFFVVFDFHQQDSIFEFIVLD